MGSDEISVPAWSAADLTRCGTTCCQQARFHRSCSHTVYCCSASLATSSTRLRTNGNGCRLLGRQRLPQELVALRQCPVDDAARAEVQDVEHHVHDFEVTELQWRKVCPLHWYDMWVRSFERTIRA